MYDVKSKHLNLKAKTKKDVKNEKKQDDFIITNTDLFVVNNLQKLHCLTKRCMNKKKFDKINKFFSKLENHLSEDLSLDKICSNQTIDLDSSDEDNLIE